MGKWSKYRKKYKKEWESEDHLKEWIVPVPGDQAKALCRFCQSLIRAHHSDLVTHAATVKHKRNVTLYTEGSPVKREILKHSKSPCSRPLVGRQQAAEVRTDVKFEIDASSAALTPELGQEEVVNPASLGFIGCGNMAQALLSAFLKEGLVDPHLTIASAPTDHNLCKLRAMGVKTTHDNNEVVRQSDLVFVCVKPHVLSPMVDNLLPLDPMDTDHSPLFVSVVAGVDILTLEEMLSVVVDQPRVVRTMPNTPSTVGQGCCLYTRGTHTSVSDAEVMNSMLSSVGMCAEIPESQMDAACGIAGSGPAYIYAAIEALADGGVKMGLPRQLAQTLAAQTVKGAATMVLESGKHPGQLKDEVCSPGGTTITGLHTLEHHGFRNGLISAVEASTLRSRELGSAK